MEPPPEEADRLGGVGDSRDRKEQAEVRRRDSYRPHWKLDLFLVDRYDYETQAQATVSPRLTERDHWRRVPRPRMDRIYCIGEQRGSWS